MKTYIIVCELTKADQEYTNLHKQLNLLKARKLFSFLWVIKSQKESYEIRDILWSAGIAHNDKILIAELNWNWAGVNISSQGDFPTKEDNLLTIIEKLRTKD